MKPLFSLRSALTVLAVAFLCVGVASAQANPETALTVASTTASPVSLVEIDGHLVSLPRPKGLTLIVSSQPTPFGATSTALGLYGSINDLQLKKTKSGSSTRVKATVSLLNSSSTALHNVTATVYLSDDNALSADDTTIITLSLANYVAKGKVGKHKTVSLPFNYKVPNRVASFLEGKYLIVVLSADDLGTLPTTPIVVGPIALP